MQNNLNTESNHLKRDIENYSSQYDSSEENEKRQEAFNRSYPSHARLSKVVNQVVDMEANDRKTVEVIKTKIKDSLSSVTVEEMFGTFGMGVVGGVLSSTMMNMPIVETTIAFNAVAALSIASIRASVGTVEALKALNDYEKNVDTLKELGIYDYVRKCVDDKKLKLEDEIHKSQTNDMLQDLENEDQKGMVR